MFCNKCGKEIPNDSKVCKYCGATTGANQTINYNVNTATSVKTKKKIYQKWWFWLIIVFLVIVIIGMTSGSGDENAVSTGNSNTISSASKNNETQSIKYTKIDIDKLEDALENNAAAAKDKYNGQYLEITGKLGVIDSDLKYISLVSLTNEWDLTGIHCTIKNNEQKEIIKTLNKGDKIVVKGKITNVGEVLGYYLDITEITQ